VEERKIGRLIALKTKFEEISKKAEYLLNLEIKSSYMKYPSESEIIAIIEDYNSARSHLNKLDLADLALILPSISQTAEYGNLHKIIINSHAAVNAIDSLIPKKIPSELANQLNDWRDEINKNKSPRGLIKEVEKFETKLTKEEVDKFLEERR